MGLLQSLLEFINKQNGIAKKIVLWILLALPIIIGAIVAFIIVVVFKKDDNGGAGQDIHILENPNGTQTPPNTQELDNKIDEINKDIS